VSDVWAALGTAEFAHIVGLSLAVSFSATAIAAIGGLPCGAALAICRFPGRRALILLSNAFLGLPPVVVGLALYLMLSSSGPLGSLALLGYDGGASIISCSARRTQPSTAKTGSSALGTGKDQAWGGRFGFQVRANDKK
jgi:ABC-type sulfate transport system permease component